jgi:hypothetical protein
MEKNLQRIFLTNITVSLTLPSPQGSQWIEDQRLNRGKFIYKGVQFLMPGRIRLTTQGATGLLRIQ